MSGTGSTSLRQAMSRFATGVIVLTVGGDHAHGMTANAFSSISLDPPLLLCCVAHSARMHRALADAKLFAISVLGAAQEDVARHFADKNRPEGIAQFAGVDWEPGPHTAAPLLAKSLAWLECELIDTHPCGDHSIFVGRLLASTVADDGDGLLFFDGRFTRLPS